MLSPSLDTLLKVSKTKYPQKLFAFDCVTLYIVMSEYSYYYDKITNLLCNYIPAMPLEGSGSHYIGDIF